MSYLQLISYLVVFVAGLAVGKFVRYLDWQGQQFKDSCKKDD